MLRLDGANYEFMMKFVLFIIGKFLNSTSRDSVKRSWVTILDNVERWNDINWCKFVIGNLVLG